jgi:nucleoside-diphosphate-sugar epimerase
MKNILITGGAGYIGTALTRLLLSKGYKVTIYDKLMYDGSVLIPFFSSPNFKFIYGDILNKEKLKNVIKENDVIIHLAAIVGYSACKKNKQLTQKINVDGTQTVLDCLNENQYLLFGSTGSNYGKVDGICTEKSPLNPTSFYAETKTQSEKMVMGRKNSTAFRFATAFGAAYKLRMDLLVNDLVYKAITDKYLVIYQPNAMRTFIHVKDIARSFLFALENKEKMVGEIYNCGSNDMNYSKREICELIKEKINCYIHYNDYDYDKDNRDYKVSYDKLNSIGFNTKFHVEEGIDELKNIYSVLNFTNKKYFNSGFPQIN